MITLLLLRNMELGEVSDIGTGLRRCYLVHGRISGDMPAQVEMVGVVVQELEDFTVVGEVADGIRHGVVRCMQIALGGGRTCLLVTASRLIFPIDPNTAFMYLCVYLHISYFTAANTCK